MTIDAFLRLLDGVKSTRRGWNARCPAHDDKSPSLSICEGEEARILLRCWAGCTAQEICQSLHLHLRELRGHTQRDSAQICHERAERERERCERENAQRIRDALADDRRGAERLLNSANDVPIGHWHDAFLNTVINKIADARDVMWPEILEDLNGTE